MVDSVEIDALSANVGTNRRCGLSKYQKLEVIVVGRTSHIRMKEQHQQQ